MSMSILAGAAAGDLIAHWVPIKKWYVLFSGFLNSN